MISGNTTIDQFIKGARASSHSSALQADLMDDVFDANAILNQLVTRHGAGARIINRKPENLELIRQALSELSAELIEKKSIAGALFDRGVSVLPGVNKNRLRAASRANTDSVLFNNETTLNLVAAMAREPDNSTNIPLEIREQARKTMDTWINSTRLAASSIEKDYTKTKDREMRNYNATDAVRDIVTGSSKAKRLRGAATIIELAGMSGKKEKSLERYLEKIEDSFSPNGHVVRAIVEQEVNAAIKELPKIMEEPDALMSEDISLISDLRSGIGSLLKHTGKVGKALQSLLNTDHDTVGRENALNEVHTIIGNFSTEHAKFDELYKGYKAAQTEISAKINNEFSVRFEFMTDKQLKNFAKGHGITASGPRSELIQRIQIQTGCKTGVTTITQDNLDIVNNLKYDAKKARDKVSDDFKKVTEELKKTMEEVPTLATTVYDIVGPRLGMGVTDKDQYFELFPQERTTLETRVKTEFEQEKQGLKSRITELDKQSRIVELRALGARSRLKQYLLGDLELNKADNVKAWLSALDKVRLERKNPNLDDLYERLIILRDELDTGSTVEEAIYISTSHHLVSFLNAEAKLDRLEGKKELQTFKSYISQNIDPSNSSIEELVNTSTTLNNIERSLGLLEASKNSAESRIRTISDPEILDTLVATEMAKRFQNNVVGAYNSFVHMGIVTDANKARVVEDLHTTAEFFRHESNNLESATLGEALLAAFNFIVSLFRNGYEGALKKEDDVK